MNIKDIQRDFELGNQIKVKLKTGDEISGQLIGIGLNGVILDRGDGQMENLDPSTIKTMSDQADSVSFEERVSERIIEIENRFNTEIQTIKLELEPPDLKFPAEELPNWENRGAAGDWARIKNKYKNLQNTNELSLKHDAVQSILNEIKSLVRRFPESPTLRRALAYFSSISEDWGEALQNYQVVAVQAVQLEKDHDYDWFNLAVSALTLNKEEIACYSLGKFFLEVTHINELQAWNVYVNLLGKFKDLSVFRALCDSEQYTIGEKEIKDLLEAAIYLLKKNTETLATEITQKWLTGEESAISLLAEASQKLDGQPTESYRQFLTEFMNTIITLKKKTVPITPEHSKRTNVQKRPISQSNSQKHKHQAHGKSGAEDLYKKAKDADENGNLEKAVELYQKCLTDNINYESAINDLAAVFLRLKRPTEAVEILEEYRGRKRNDVSAAVNNQLINCYGHTKEYDKAIILLDSALQDTQDREKQFQIRMQIANLYNMSGKHEEAAIQFTHLQEMRPDNITVQHNLAICYAKKADYDKAKEILQTIHETSPDVKTAELLETIEKFEKGNSNSEIEFTTELRRFDLFHLERCEFSGVPGTRVWEGKYVGNTKQGKRDIDKAVEDAKRQQTIRPEDRKKYYLTAARIYFDLEDYNDNLYRYLCRCYASMGDDARDKGLDLDIIRGYYCEVLRVYDVVYHSEDRVEEQDAGNALSWFLLSYLGIEHIPRSSPKIGTLKDQKNYIVNAIKEVISKHPDTNKMFDVIGYLMNSRYAKSHILPCLYNNTDLKEKALTYLRDNGIEISDTIENQEDFNRGWNTLRRKNVNENASISGKFDDITKGFELTIASLENNIEQIQQNDLKLFFKLDQDYIESFIELLTKALSLCNEVGFDEQSELYHDLETRCSTLLTSIEENPISLSIEKVYPIIKIIKDKVEEYYASLCNTSKPELTLKPLRYNYMETDQKLTVQIEVENKKGRMTARSLELIIIENEAYFSVSENTTLRLDKSLRGGEKEVLQIDLNLTDSAINTINTEKNKEPFSLAFHAKYSTFRDNDLKTQTQESTIELNSKKEFEEIPNPYSWGQEVTNKKMFYGRDELINRIATDIGKAGTENRCLFVYGQYRSGKSSVRYHLKTKLELEDDYKQLFVVDLMNIDAIQHDKNKSTFLSSLFRHIIKKSLEAAIKKEIDNEDFSSLSELSENDDISLSDFTSAFSNLKQTLQDNCDIQQVVLLIDEFQYIYYRMLAEELDANFMQIWKGFLQENLFSAVLVGQLVMAKLRDKFNIDNVLGSMNPEQVTYLQREHAKQLIVEPIRIDGKEGQSRYLGSSVERILELTGGSPYYIQRFCHDLVIRMNNVEKSDWVTKSLVDEEASKLIRNVSQSFFHNLLQSGDESKDEILEADILTVLSTIAQRSNDWTGRCPKEHLDNLKLQTHMYTIDDILNDLMEREVIERELGSYSIKVGLFKEWLIHRG